jgi:hypothetical protein
MQKMIKLSEIHYIIVDDSEIKEGDYRVMVDKKSTFYDQFEKHLGNHDCNDQWAKITHSTQPLNEQCQNVCSGFCINCPDTSVKRLDLSEAQEIEFGYSVEKMAKNGNANMKCFEEIWIEGFKAAMELVKDKLFTAQDVINIVKKSRETGLTAEYFITKHLLPKTEWDVEFVDGKIVLL